MWPNYTASAWLDPNSVRAMYYTFRQANQKPERNDRKKKRNQRETVSAQQDAPLECLINLNVQRYRFEDETYKKV
jgi:hypothetical protein